MMQRPILVVFVFWYLIILVLGVLFDHPYDLRGLLEESDLVERKSFIRSFVKEVKVTGDEVLLTYTMPLLP